MGPRQTCPPHFKLLSFYNKLGPPEMRPERDDVGHELGRQQVVHLRREQGHELRALLLLVVGEAARALNSLEVPGGMVFFKVSSLSVGCGPSRQEQNDSSVVLVYYSILKRRRIIMITRVQSRTGVQ